MPVKRRCLLIAVAVLLLAFLAAVTWTAVGALPAYRLRATENRTPVRPPTRAAQLDIATARGRVIASGGDIAGVSTSILGGSLEVTVRPHTVAYRALAAAVSTDGSSGPDAVLRLGGRIIARGFLALDYLIGDPEGGPSPGDSGFFYQGDHPLALYDFLTSAPSAAHEKAVLRASVVLGLAFFVCYVVAIGLATRWRIWSLRFPFRLAAGVLVPSVAAALRAGRLPGGYPVGVALWDSIVACAAVLVAWAAVGLVQAWASARRPAA
jgi:hypothetical protein